jgi:hypothetical protein
MLLLAFGGRFTEPGWPWMMQDQYGHRWIDFDAIPVHVDGLSGGERRFLLIAASLGGNWPLILNDALPGLDRALLVWCWPRPPTPRAPIRIPS